jgi:hypothetical protein
MGYWLEVRCDIQCSGDACLTFNNNGPKLHAVTVEIGERLLDGDAKRQGWLKTKRGWCCPACKHYARNLLVRGITV